MIFRVHRSNLSGVSFLRYPEIALCLTKLFKNLRGYCCFLCLFAFLWVGLNIHSALSEPFNVPQRSALQERLASYPYWEPLTTTGEHKGEIHYPQWFTGTWQVTSTLVDQQAPLAPDVVSPGFEQNERWLDEPVQFPVRYLEQRLLPEFTWAVRDWVNPEVIVIPDRRFNAESIARAYLGERQAITSQLTLKPMPQLVTQFSPQMRLISTITSFKQEEPNPTEFLTTELSSQQFIREQQQYLNQVETTTDYRYLGDGQIRAEQVTAIYLSPQDPDFFTARDRPIAVYKYDLLLTSQASPT